MIEKASSTHAQLVRADKNDADVAKLPYKKKKHSFVCFCVSERGVVENKQLQQHYVLLMGPFQSLYL